MKVFFPSHCLSAKSGFICGWKKEQQNTFVATTVIYLPDCSVKLEIFCEKAEQLSLSILGVWLNESHEKSVREVLAAVETASRSFANEPIVMRLARNASVPQLYIGSEKLRSGLDGSVVILYKQPSGNAFLSTGPSNVSDVKFLRQFQRQEQTSCTELSEVLILLNKSHHAEASVQQLLETNAPNELLHSPRNLFYSLTVKAFSNVCSVMSQRRRQHHPILAETVKFLSSSSAVFLQICRRFRQMKALCVCLDQPRSTKDKQDNNSAQSGKSSSSSSSSSDKQNQSLENDNRDRAFPLVWFGSLLCTMAVDIVLGVFLVSWLFSNGYNMCATDFMMEKTDTVVELLNTLLDWLKGAPAGLKLNKHLAEYLSTFFLYHVYLWQIYLNCIVPYLPIIVSLIILSGCFGVTFLLSLASDVLSLVTLHIYCFYVYAARIYNLQLQMLVTLAKLFTGRKWNVEKNQVDIVPYRADRLFLGTLCFTILLFLLPTTAAYYVVFTALRIMVLFVKGTVGRVINMMHNLPVFPLIITFVRSDLIPGGVKFEFLGSSDTLTPDRNKLQPFVKGTTGPLSAVYLVLHNQPVPMMDLLQCQLTDQYSDHGDYSWPMLLGRLAKGELIYPWVKSNNFRDQLKKQFSAAQHWLHQ